jgi:CDP-diacylglycerol--serine O-phosphatidyltransferase
LVFAVCCVVRLARFNIDSKSDEDTLGDGSYFVGIPAPAGALLVMLPMYLSFMVADRAVLPGILICAYMILIGLLMISRIPTWSFKTTRVSRSNVKFFLVGFAFVGAALLTYAWTTLVLLCLGYIGVVVWAFVTRKTSPQG